MGSRACSRPSAAPLLCAYITQWGRKPALRRVPRLADNNQRLRHLDGRLHWHAVRPRAKSVTSLGVSPLPWALLYVSLAQIPLGMGAGMSKLVIGRVLKNEHVLHVSSNGYSGGTALRYRAGHAGCPSGRPVYVHMSRNSPFTVGFSDCDTCHFDGRTSSRPHRPNRCHFDGCHPVGLTAFSGHPHEQFTTLTRKTVDGMPTSLAAYESLPPHPWKRFRHNFQRCRDRAKTLRGSSWQGNSYEILK